MAEVWLARRHSGKRRRLVALKIAKAGYQDRMDREIRALGTMKHPKSHPNIVTLLETGKHSTRLWYTMPYYPRRTLKDESERWPLNLRRAAALLLELVGGAEHVHQRGWIHRDIKPDNVFVTSKGTPILGDFGLARSYGRGQSEASDLTELHTIMGTAGYMAPEQARGDSRLAGPQADVYSLGCMMYELGTGRTPFSGPRLEQIDGHLLRMPAPPSQLNPGLPLDFDRVCLRCLEKKPSDRYRSCGSLADELKFLANLPSRRRR
jgi:serine/threonine-protein kinase